MVIKELINLLSKYDLKPYPDTRAEGISYSYFPVTNDGTVEIGQFELTIANKNLIKCYEAKDEINDILITLGDEQLTNNILSITQSGGGYYRDNDLNIYKLQVNYAVTYRMH